MTQVSFSRQQFGILKVLIHNIANLLLFSDVIFPSLEYFSIYTHHPPSIFGVGFNF